jgi:signal transduction histidine kinase
VTETQTEKRGSPGRLIATSILALLLVLAIAGVVGVIENSRLKDSASRAIQSDVAISAVGDDIRVAALDLRFLHRSIVDSGPSDTLIQLFDETYLDLLAEFDTLESLNVGDLAIPQPQELRDLAATYQSSFRPSIALFVSDPIAFNNAAAQGLEQLDQLISKAEQINDAGELLTEHSLGHVEDAADRERLILLALLVGVGLIGVLLLLSLARIVQQLQAANLTEHAARTELAESLQMKTNFIADASHELRTPITLIRGNAELSLLTAENPDQRESLQEIYDESTRMAGLVNDLLLLARSDVGSLPLDLEYLPTGLVASRIEVPARAMAEQHGRKLQTDMHGSGHVQVDLARLEQTIMILLDNAAKFSPIGSAIMLDSLIANDHLEISVTDQGPGIPTEELDRVFDRFYQVRENARHRGGAGIGLSIARSIIEAHGGSVGVTSTPGHGATFTIKLPLVEEPVQG